MWTLSATWNLLFSSFSVMNLIGIAAAVVAVLTPPMIAQFIPNLRVVAICVAALCFSNSIIAGKFYHDGLRVKQAEWDQARKIAVDRGKNARRDAEHDLSDGSSRPGRMSKDEFDRD